MVFLVMGRSAENIEEKKKTNRWKALKSEEKNEEYEESQITTIFGVKLYYARKHNLKKSCSYHQILFTVFMRCRIFET